ncbi:uncharacterized protein LOC131222869 isoform X2 [Magnolia sinica]|uniref:uncharacterized protein LOC131222869 isoform X2 n=1 Tax=Magnolia sinica TaxID=86752 RepID=UPI0026595A64|nr:uncharacterized protein LOC131222869 isoform X2 [Magnolia sinica]
MDAHAHAHDPHAMALPPTFPPPHHHLDMKPQFPPHHHPLPPSQPSIPPSLPLQPPVPTDTIISPATAIHHPYTLHYHPHPHQTAAPAVYINPEQQKIHTLFVSGLPDDVKPREIHNLFRRRQGFSSCQLKYTGKGDQVVAFATFFNHQSAVVAMSALDGVIFDPQTGARLHVELARTNSRSKRPRGGEAYAVIDKRVRIPDDTQESGSNDGDGGSDEPSGTDNPDSSNKGALAATQSGEMAGDLDNAPLNMEKPTAGDIPPCSTLFIANLGPNCTEEEIKQVLSQYTGFHTLKMRARGGMPVAFADFKEVENATEAMNGLQGSLLASSDRGGMHLEYARSKMRKR